MLGAIIGDLAAWTWENDHKNFYPKLVESTSKAWCTHIVTHYILKNSNGRLSDFRISGLGL